MDAFRRQPLCFEARVKDGSDCLGVLHPALGVVGRRGTANSACEDQSNNGEMGVGDPHDLTPFLGGRCV